MTISSLIGIDWGTTSFRAWTIDSKGNINQQIEQQAGILSITDRNFEDVFETSIGSWLKENPKLPIVVSGMITSRNGWYETPYLSLPVQSSDLAAALVPFRTKHNREIFFVTGIVQNIDNGIPDVMRGEETELIGAIAKSKSSDGLYILPGTHSKWVLVKQGAITRFETYMTGELFALLCQHSIIGRLIEAGPWSKKIFSQGINEAGREQRSILSIIFSARTLALFGRITGNEISDYLSGLLIGSEVTAGLNKQGKPSTVTLIGRGDLLNRYTIAFQENGVEVISAKSGMACRGLFEIASKAGLI